MMKSFIIGFKSGFNKALMFGKHNSDVFFDIIVFTILIGAIMLVAVDYFSLMVLMRKAIDFGVSIETLMWIESGIKNGILIPMTAVISSLMIVGIRFAADVVFVNAVYKRS